MEERETTALNKPIKSIDQHNINILTNNNSISRSLSWKDAVKQVNITNFDIYRLCKFDTCHGINFDSCQHVSLASFQNIHSTNKNTVLLKTKILLKIILTDVKL